MLKAMLQQGMIVPLEALPLEWGEGTVLEIAKAASPAFDIDAWAEQMNQLCADSEATDEDRMRQLIEEHQQHAKADVRREMGLGA